MMHLPSMRPKKNHECKGGHGRLLGEQKAAEMGLNRTGGLTGGDSVCRACQAGEYHTQAK